MMIVSECKNNARARESWFYLEFLSFLPKLANNNNIMRRIISKKKKEKRKSYSDKNQSLLCTASVSSWFWSHRLTTSPLYFIPERYNCWRILVALLNSPTIQWYSSDFENSFKSLSCTKNCDHLMHLLVEIYLDSRTQLTHLMSIGREASLWLLLPLLLLFSGRMIITATTIETSCSCLRRAGCWYSRWWWQRRQVKAVVPLLMRLSNAV